MRKIAELVDAAFLNSAKFMSALLTKKRAEVALGGALLPEEARTVRLNMAGRNGWLCWEGFFLLTASSSKQSREVVRESFMVAWDTNINRTDKYKLVRKLHKFNLLFDEELIKRLFESGDEKSWLEYLGSFNQKIATEFPGAWFEKDGEKFERGIMNRRDGDWKHVLFVLSFLKKGIPFPIGVLQDIDDDLPSISV